mmetsp:Transcript_54228/g.118229  ORF Transcript_54228/g.118229 Transcript_54228/m.118229 type:complete len:248 (+) Transcript_54228:1-744(+)
MRKPASSRCRVGGWASYPERSGVEGETRVRRSPKSGRGGVRGACKRGATRAAELCQAALGFAHLGRGTLAAAAAGPPRPCGGGARRAMAISWGRYELRVDQRRRRAWRAPRQGAADVRAQGHVREASPSLSSGPAAVRGLHLCFTLFVIIETEEKVAAELLLAAASELRDDGREVRHRGAGVLVGVPLRLAHAAARRGAAAADLARGCGALRVRRALRAQAGPGSEQVGVRVRRCSARRGVERGGRC